MTTEILLAVIFILVLSTLALLLWSWKTREDSSREGKEQPDFSEIAGGSECPLCGEHLPRGVRVHSTVYRGKEFDLMRIYGCPHCWTGHAAAAESHGFHKRRCPYCGDTLPENGYVMARVYQKPYRRTHVNVYGCTQCKPGRG